ncbi:hypothetical protein AB3X52_00995 [Nocardioides sp. DS6]|uniref:Uncharacterized protein n=1 Tax=Nocardioides eburneus TaxID=3231482 RepID=A0ABV3STB3_9ACTN
MSSTGYLIWFLAQAVVTVAIMVVCIAGANGVFTKETRARRHRLAEERRAEQARVSVPRQRSASPAPAPTRSDTPR